MKTPTPFEKNTGLSHMCPVSVPAEPGFLFGDHTFHNTYHSFIRRGTPVSLLLFHLLSLGVLCTFGLPNPQI